MIEKLGILENKVYKRRNKRKYKNREVKMDILFLELWILIEKAVYICLELQRGQENKREKEKNNYIKQK